MVVDVRSFKSMVSCYLYQTKMSDEFKPRILLLANNNAQFMEEDKHIVIIGTVPVIIARVMV